MMMIVFRVQILQDELLELLGKAVTCAILGKAGQQRTRVLGLLYQDDRLSGLDQLTAYSSHYTVLSKMFKEQILKREELAVFEESLMPHQKAVRDMSCATYCHQSPHATLLVH